MIVSIWRNLQRLSVGKKSTSSFMVSLGYCKSIVLVVFGTLVLSGYLHPRWYYHLAENFCVFFCRQKLNFIPYPFMEILQRYANLFWVLWTYTVTRTQNNSITLLKTSMFIYMQKLNFIIHFFLTILHFKEAWNLIGRQHFGR